MKTSKNYRIDHVAKTIIISRNFARQANTRGSRAYKELMDLRKECAGYEVERRTSIITEPDKKNTHLGLNIEFMRGIIAKRGETAKLAYFEKALMNNVAYPTIKAWFLKEENFKDYKNAPKYEMPKEESLLAEGGN